MKRTLLAATLTLCLTAPLWAQDASSDTSTSTPPTPPPGGFHHFQPLTEDERTELKAAHDAAVAANPDLQTQEQQLRAGWKDYEQKMHDAMVKADPKVEAILEKMHHHGPPPPDGGSAGGANAGGGGSGSASGGSQ